MIAALQEKIRHVDVNAIAAVDRELLSLPAVEAPTECIFTPGMMTRKIFMAAGTRHRSKIHKTRNQFVILQGAALVSENGNPHVLMVAPHHGITEPGTWRHLFILMDSIWLTMHPTDKTTIQEVESDIIQSEAQP